MRDAVMVVDTSDVRPGQLERLRAAIGELAAFVEQHEPRTLAYHVFLDPKGARMTVVQVHPDSASLEHHMAVAAPAFAKFQGLLRLRSMDVYGPASETVLAQLRRKATLLGDARLEVHERYAGFARFGPA